jgi:hypothetical protein
MNDSPRIQKIKAIGAVTSVATRAMPRISSPIPALPAEAMALTRGVISVDIDAATCLA